MEKILKAYRLDLGKISEPWFVENNVVYAENASKAKSLLWNSIKQDDLRLSNYKDITFLNLPVIRDKDSDKVLFESLYLTRQEIEAITDTRARDQSHYTLLENNREGFCYIKKGGYYYRPGSAGYTEYIIDAGIFSIQQAVVEVVGCSLDSHIRAILINKFDHNTMIQNKIKELQQRIL